MRVLGIDPGSATTGYGIVDARDGGLRHVDNGVLSPGSGVALPRRLLEIFRGVEALIGRFQPDTVAIENIFIAKNARSSLLLGHARGVAMLAACAAELPVEEYTPMQVKQAVAGTGRADKGQVQQMVRALLKLPEVACEDAADALAVAICCCNSAALRNAVARAARPR